MSHCSYRLLIGTLLVYAMSSHAAVPDRSQLNKTAEQLAVRLVREMTVGEKIELIEMQNGAIERLGIPAHHWWNEALHGVARRGKATQFPVPLSMASTWNPELIHAMASAISDEARARHHADSDEDRTKTYHGLSIWSPVINMARDPRWGRTEETYGEDPHLTGKLGVAFVTGIQGDRPDYLKAIATVKHFVANNTEYNRLEANPGISQRSLREYYFPAFRMAVEEGDVESIMTAYNGINGVPSSANRWLVTDVLRGEWDFNGTVVTDVFVPRWLFQKHQFTKDGAGAAAAMIKAGIDVYSGGEKIWTKEAIEAGLLDESELDRAVTQSLASRIKLGLLRAEEDNPYTKIPTDIVGSDKHLAIARQIAREGIVLLKNENQVLPASPKNYQRIILAGPYANNAPLGAYSGTPTKPSVSPDAGFRNIAGNNYKIDNQYGGKWAPVSEQNLTVHGDRSTHGLKGEYFPGPRLEGIAKTTRIDKNINFEWPKPLEHIDPAIPQPKFSVRWVGELTPNRTGEHVFSIEAESGAKVWLDGKLIMDIWHRKAEDFVVSKPILLTAGEPVSLRIEYNDMGSFNPGAMGGGKIWVRFNWIEPQQKTQAGNPEKELLVYVGGLTHEMAHESKDLMDMRFPADQLEEIAELARIYPHMAVVVNTGTGVQLDELRKLVPTLLIQWFPGQEGGNALAEIITGKVNPSGHLPLTIYTDATKLPDLDDYEIQKGRTYMYATDNVTYAFGHGIGYSEFKYNNLQVTQDNEIIRVSVDVENIGAMDGDEVVQLYVSNLDSAVYQPLKQLKGFKRVSVARSEKVRVELSIPVDSLAWWDEWQQRFVVNPGRYEIQVGSSAADIRGKHTLRLDDSPANQQAHGLPDHVCTRRFAHVLKFMRKPYAGLYSL